MRVVVATNAGGLEDDVSPVFARCQTYTIVEIENKEIKNVTTEKNQAISIPMGAGVTAAQYIIDSGAEAVIAGNFGPNAFSILEQAGIKVYSVFGMKVKDAIQQLIEGTLKPASVSGPPGMPQGPGFGPGRGRGVGGGRGRGRGQQ